MLFKLCAFLALLILLALTTITLFILHHHHHHDNHEQDGADLFSRLDHLDQLTKCKLQQDRPTKLAGASHLEALSADESVRVSMSGYVELSSLDGHHESHLEDRQLIGYLPMEQVDSLVLVEDTGRYWEPPGSANNQVKQPVRGLWINTNCVQLRLDLNTSSQHVVVGAATSPTLVHYSSLIRASVAYQKPTVGANLLELEGQEHRSDGQGLANVVESFELFRAPHLGGASRINRVAQEEPLAEIAIAGYRRATDYADRHAIEELECEFVEDKHTDRFAPELGDSLHYWCNQTRAYSCLVSTNKTIMSSSSSLKLARQVSNAKLEDEHPGQVNGTQWSAGTNKTTETPQWSKIEIILHLTYFELEINRAKTLSIRNNPEEQQDPWSYCTRKGGYSSLVYEANPPMAWLSEMLQRSRPETEETTMTELLGVVNEIDCVYAIWRWHFSMNSVHNELNSAMEPES